MSLFKPLNSAESNLFTIRCVLGVGSPKGVFDTIPDGHIIAGSSDQTVDTDYLSSPSSNNLPSGFKIVYSSTGPAFTVTYGKKFTSFPSISITPHSSTACNFFITNHTTTTVTFKSDINASTDGTTNLLGFDLVITGPIKLGTTTGNSNKGWSLGGIEQDKLYSYFGTGIGTGAPVDNTLTLGYGFVGIPETISTASAVSLETYVTLLNFTGAITIDDGESGQIKIITSISAGDVTLANTKLNQTQVGNSITWDSIGDSVTLLYANNVWNIISSNGVTIT